MKKLLYVAAVLVLLVSNAVSYEIGKSKWYSLYDKAYEDAARMSDLIRCYSDHLGDSVIEDYGCFDELKDIFLWDDSLGEPVDLSEYVYGY